MSGIDWNWAFALQVLPAILRAGSVTLIATVASFAIAIVAGLALAVGMGAPSRGVRWPLLVLTEFIRRTPVLVQIYFVFFVLPRVGIVIPALAAGILTLGLHFSTYVAEVYRAGIESIPRSQWDAATALNLSRYRTLWDVILPQALPPIVPALGNYLLILFKETPLLSAIAVVEMLDRAKIIGSLTFRYTEPVTLVGLIFLLLSLLSAWGIRNLERRLGRWS